MKNPKNQKRTLTNIFFFFFLFFCISKIIYKYFIPCFVTIVYTLALTIYIIYSRCSLHPYITVHPRTLIILDAFLHHYNLVHPRTLIKLDASLHHYNTVHPRTIINTRFFLASLNSCATLHFN